MSDKVYKIVEIVGTSSKGFDQAAANAVARASKTLHDLSWFEVAETRGSIKDGKIDQYQAKVKIAFKLDDA